MSERKSQYGIRVDGKPLEDYVVPAPLQPSVPSVRTPAAWDRYTPAPSPATAGYRNDHPIDGPTCKVCGAVVQSANCLSCGSPSPTSEQPIFKRDYVDAAVFDGSKPLVLRPGDIAVTSEPSPASGEQQFKLGDWIHSDSGVGQIVKFDEGTPMIISGLAGHGFHCYHARLATAKEIEAAKRGEYITDEGAASSQPEKVCPMCAKPIFVDVPAVSQDDGSPALEQDGLTSKADCICDCGHSTEDHEYNIHKEHKYAECNQCSCAVFVPVGSPGTVDEGKESAEAWLIRKTMHSSHSMFSEKKIAEWLYEYSAVVARGQVAEIAELNDRLEQASGQCQRAADEGEALRVKVASLTEELERHKRDLAQATYALVQSETAYSKLEQLKARAHSD